jgi:hypothetical protein
VAALLEREGALQLGEELLNLFSVVLLSCDVDPLSQVVLQDLWVDASVVLRHHLLKDVNDLSSLLSQGPALGLVHNRLNQVFELLGLEDFVGQDSDVQEVNQLQDYLVNFLVDFLVLTDVSGHVSAETGN